jgi:hypothetical protein
MQMSWEVRGLHTVVTCGWHMAFSYPIVDKEKQVPVLQSGTRLKQTGQKWESNVYIRRRERWEDCLVPHLNQSLSWQHSHIHHCFVNNLSRQSLIMHLCCMILYT